MGYYKNQIIKEEDQELEAQAERDRWHPQSERDRWHDQSRFVDRYIYAQKFGFHINDPFWLPNKNYK